ncbi:SAM-dependent methyltransferase [Kitasatospora purpeofusca]|uniref:SAM-dependent methyltransferase n=1 Tax=Kitasatospora purpeofusca TaxID=67352 RepID=UPI003688E9E1
MTPQPPDVRNGFEQAAFEYYDNKRADALNLDLGHEDGFYHHHFAITDFDRTVLAEERPELREKRVRSELHRLETHQVTAFSAVLGDFPPTGRILDAGSGRGGTSLLLHQRYGCEVDAVNFSGYQNGFAREAATALGVADRVRFHDANMVHTGFADATFDAVVTNETTMYVDLDEAFTEFARVLKPLGRYVLTTWCINDAYGATPVEAAEIDEHYRSRTHTRDEYLTALRDHGLFPYQVDDLTEPAIPYWELRTHSRLATGIERPYLASYRTNRINYMRIASRRTGTGIAGRAPAPAAPDRRMPRPAR